MNFKVLFFLLTFVLLTKYIDCQDDTHFELSQRHILEQCKWEFLNGPLCISNRSSPWLTSSFLPHLDNGSELNCSKSNWDAESKSVSSSHLSDFSTKWSFGKVDNLSNLASVLNKTWSEYGGCITKVDQLSDVPKYLSKSYELYDKYNMTEILRRGNITFGKNYTYQEISDAVSQTIGGKKPIVKCLFHTRANKLLLDEITIFFDKSLNVIDPLKNWYPKKCSSTFPISYEDSLHVRKNFDRIKPYDDPFEKYPTLREDDNGYYLFMQKNVPAACPKSDSTKCHKTKYTWAVDLFTFVFRKNIDLFCLQFADTPYFKHEFNFTSLSAIENEIKDKWGFKPEAGPALFRDLWDGLGRCTVHFKKLETEYKFYKKSLELFDKYNMETILKQSNILPGKNHTYQEIADAASKAIDGKTPVMICNPRSRPESDRQILYIIGFFMDINFNPANPMNIGTPLGYPYVRCKPDRMIFYEDVED